MIEVIKKCSLVQLMREKTKDSEVAEQVSRFAVDFLADFLNNMANEILDEAINTKYYRILPIDINRGCKKFEDSIIEKRFGKSASALLALLNFKSDKE